ncbi:MAG: hypothetical protein IT425_00310 [Pirellulales bacterium]|nr:hypothetical protein [Pirellulales bacterium]
MLYHFARYRVALALVGVIGGLVASPSALAKFVTTGVYDENTNQANSVDTLAASSNINLADFSTLVADAFSAGNGGVISFDILQPGTLGFGASDADSNGTQLNAVYGAAANRTLVITRELYAGGTGAPTFSVTSSSSTLESISGSSSSDADQKIFGSQSGDGSDWRMTFNKPLIAFGITALYRPSDYTIGMEIGLSDSSTFEFNQETITAAAGGNGTDDTFFGYEAPSGLTIQYVRANNSALARWDDLAFATVPEALPKLFVDRTTGNLTLSNTTGADISNIVGYTISSVAETLDPADAVWNSISDTNSNWTELTNPTDHTNLSELETGPVFGGITVVNNGTIDFGDTWVKYPVEDIQMTLLIDDNGNQVQTQVDVFYVPGTGGFSQFVAGDFNFDGSVDEQDYTTFLANLPSDHASLTLPETYALGDISGDRAIDFEDIGLFADAFDTQNGQGAFLTMLGQVPEPTGPMLAALGAMLFAWHRIGRSTRTRSILLGLALLACWHTAAPSHAVAQLNSVTNNNSNDPLDVYIIGPNPLADGELISIDRPCLFSNLPAAFNGLDYIMTANDDKTAPSITVDVTFDAGTVLYLGLDDRLGDNSQATPPTLGNGVMDWVLSQGWQDTGFNYYRSDDDPSRGASIYRLKPTGTSITLLEQNNGSSRSMYNLFGGIEVIPTLVVNRGSGDVQIQNPAGAAYDLDYYEITSTGQSLNLGGWSSLDLQNQDAVDGTDLGTVAGDSPLEGWDQGGSSNSSALVELFLTGSSSLGSQASLSLGTAYDTTTDAQDLIFQYSLAGSNLLQLGVVKYVGGLGGLPGDFNADTFVDSADYVLWRKNLNGNESVLNGNGDGSGTVDPGDYNLWRASFGNSAGSGSLSTEAVPEPSLGVLTILAATVICVSRHSRSARRPIAP